LKNKTPNLSCQVKWLVPYKVTSAKNTTNQQLFSRIKSNNTIIKIVAPFYKGINVIEVFVLYQINIQLNVSKYHQKDDLLVRQGRSKLNLNKIRSPHLLTILLLGRCQLELKLDILRVLNV
jgi:hypothetical protein